MNVAYEDKKLHNDGIFDGFMGYKEWFHYLGTFSIKGSWLTFMLGFPMSYTGMGAFGWISFKGKQYSLAGNLKDTDRDGFYELQRIPVQFRPSHTGYTLWYIAEPEPYEVYNGIIKGKFPEKNFNPHYTFDIETPDLHVEIEMKINTPESLYTKEVFSWMPDEKRIASWFHSGDVSASLKGFIGGEDVTSDATSKGWYERMWSKVIVLVPSEWLWLMSHLDNGAVFDLYTAKTAGLRVHPLDECWLYLNGAFHEFSHYCTHFPEGLEDAIKKKKYSDIIGECITCEGNNKNKTKSFRVEATVVDFRQYEFRNYAADIRYTNFILETVGEAVIDGEHIDMKGRGAAERAPVLYWWL